jgi:hypothetical protein
VIEEKIAGKPGILGFLTEREISGSIFNNGAQNIW